MNTGIIIGLLALGFVAGILSSMIGIGGGIVIVPVLVFIFGLSQKTAQGTSLAMLLPPIGLLGVLAYHKSGNVRWDMALLLIVAFIGGSYLGGQWTQKLNSAVVKKFFAVFMILVAVKYLFFDKAPAKAPEVNKSSASIQTNTEQTQ